MKISFRISLVLILSFSLCKTFAQKVDANNPTPFSQYTIPEIRDIARQMGELHTEILMLSKEDVCNFISSNPKKESVHSDLLERLEKFLQSYLNLKIELDPSQFTQFYNNNPLDLDLITNTQVGLSSVLPTGKFSKNLTIALDALDSYLNSCSSPDEYKKGIESLIDKYEGILTNKFEYYLFASSAYIGKSSYEYFDTNFTSWYDVINECTNQRGPSLRDYKAIKNIVKGDIKGVIVGGIAGAYAGATGGTVTIPGIGTVAGAACGALAGGAVTMISGSVGAAIDAALDWLFGW